MSNSELPERAPHERPQTNNITLFFDACMKGGVELLRGILMNDPGRVRARNGLGWSGVHEAAKRGHADAVRLLLETVPALFDAGADVHGSGDVHELDVIGWATVFRAPCDIPWDVLSLLLERGARHHIFPAIGS